MESKTSYWECSHCNETFAKRFNYQRHLTTRKHRNNVSRIAAVTLINESKYEVRKLDSAFQSRIQTILIQPSKFCKEDNNIATFLEGARQFLLTTLHDQLEKKNALKVNLKMQCEYEKPSNGDETEFALKTSNLCIFRNDDLNEKISKLYESLLVESTELQQKGSGWAVKEVVALEVAINKYDPLRIGSYIKLPAKFRYTNSIINVHNTDNKCLWYCIYAKFFKHSDIPHDPNRYSNIEKRTQKKYNVEFDFTGIDFPCSPESLYRFERQNPMVSINVFELDKSKVYPLKVCDEEKRFHYDLLYLSNGETNHYALIKNFNKLIRPQLTKAHSSITTCKRCLTHFQGPKKLARLEDHKKYCNQKFVEEPAKAYVPEKGSTLKFEKWEYTYPLHYVAFADFECILEPIKNEEEEEEKNTKKVNKHIPVSFCYYIVGPNNEKYKGPISYTGPDAAKIFYKMISKDARDIYKLYNTYKNVPELSQEECETLAAQKYCCICKKAFELTDVKVTHHDHATTQIFGSAHAKCNLRVKCPTYLPVFLHNMSNYDGHLILKGFDATDVGDLKVIPSTEEKYISFSKCVTKLKPKKQEGLTKNEKKNKTKKVKRFWIRFVDSYRFLSLSLRGLVELLPSEQLRHSCQYFSDPMKFSMAQQKAFFCYEYLDCLEKLEERQLPPHESFYSSLNNSNITVEEYRFAQKAWHAFECSTLSDYVTVYCMIDVLLLVDVFIEFRKKCMETYQLDVCQFFSLPGYTWQAMLKYCKVELELLTDIDQILFLERSIRGGITQCISRHANGNNIQMAKYEANESPVTILYIDSNNLYGWALCEPMPYSSFTWLNETDFDQFTPENILAIPEDGDTGYFFQVDLHYPEEIHDLHDDLPFCPEKKKTLNGKVKKLLCTLEDKQDYVLHYRMLQLCLKHGLQLAKITKILKFRQMSFLRPYIELNTSLRQKSTNDFDKNLYKLLTNSLFGKSIERTRERINFGLYCDPIKAEKAIAKPSFKKSIIFHENLVGIHKYKQKINLNKPIYIGASVLDVSKILMYKFFYEQLSYIFNDIPKPKLLYMDTDSFILSVLTANICPYIQKNMQYFDTSNYPPDHPCFSLENKAVPGLFKDELAGCACSQYIGLCPKTYSLEIENLKTNTSDYIKKAKGVKKDIVKKEITFNDYYKCLTGQIIIRKEQKNFRSILHTLFTQSQMKTALQLICDKRHFLPESQYLESHSYGHYKLKNVTL